MEQEATRFKGSYKGDANNSGCNSNGGRQRPGGAATATRGAVGERGHRPSIIEDLVLLLRENAKTTTMSMTGMMAMGIVRMMVVSLEEGDNFM